ncbi:MAG: tRNA (adenosine(37)-N6)-threonylcarbamoyltransferase complex transferase subunit TsaD [Planctomycetota bacterium]
MSDSDVVILGIETSCDETAASVVVNGRDIRSSVVASQVALHEKYGGVVPELASRAHVEKILPIVEQAMADAGVTADEIDAVAIANQPGLTISLMVGVTAAKTLAFAWDKPLVAVNHVHAHLQSALIECESVDLPAVALIVSGGHSNLYDAESVLDLRLLGKTIDDAAGEAFDKVATILGLPYPGGPNIERIAREGNPKAVRFPRSLMGKDSLDFSFSGLKTAVLYHCQGQDMKGESRVASMSQQEIADIAASFQAASVLMGGGVACNGALREAMEQMCNKQGLAFISAPRNLCTDNAVMVASLAYYKYQAGQFADLSLEPKATSD